MKHTCAKSMPSISMQYPTRWHVQNLITCPWMGWIIFSVILSARSKEGGSAPLYYKDNLPNTIISEMLLSMTSCCIFQNYRMMITNIPFKPMQCSKNSHVFCSRIFIRSFPTHGWSDWQATIPSISHYLLMPILGNGHMTKLPGVEPACCEGIQNTILTGVIKHQLNGWSWNYRFWRRYSLVLL